MLEIASFFVFSDIYIENNIHMKTISENRIDQIITEELSKSEVNSIVASKISSSYDTREFERKVKEIVADAIEDLYKTLFNRSSSWKGGVVR
jgi:hypothetical protein